MSPVVLLPLLVVIIGYGLVGPSPVLAAFLALVALAPHLVRKRIVARPFVHIVTPLILFILAVVGLGFAIPEQNSNAETIRPLWASFAGASLLATCSRHYFARPLGGDNVTIGITLLTLVSLGDIRQRDDYLMMCAAYLVTALLARRYGDRGRPALQSLGWKYGASILVMLGIAGAVGVKLSESIPRMHSSILASLGYGKGRTGFSRHLWLGSLRGLLESQELVMRVHGLPTDYLRGIVYTRYAGGRWSQGKQSDGRYLPMPKALESRTDSTEIEYLNPDPKHYFLPRNVSALAVPSGAVVVNRWGVVTPAPMRSVRWLRFRVGAKRVISEEAPEAADTAIGSELANRLHPLASRWTAQTPEPREKLLALQRQLQKNFSYSLQFQSTPGADPVETFLFDQRKGHCEYFASAMALLSRSIGIPARVVGGYRVWERNVIAGYYLVREKNAHAWVEAWTPSHGWERFDPTPSRALAEQNSGETQVISAVFDLGKRLTQATFRWLGRRSTTEFILPPLILLAFGLLLRWFKRRKDREKIAQRAQLDAPLPCMVQLSEALEACGIWRRPNEPVEVLAQRLDASPLPQELISGAGSAIRSYIAFRFGGHGKRERIDQQMGAAIEKLHAHLRQSAVIDNAPPSSQLPT